MLGGKAVVAAAGGLVLLLVAFITIAGGGQVASAEAPSGGCAVQVSGPGATGPGTSGGEQKDATLNANQMAVARTVVAVGKGMNITKRGTTIGLAVAMQESSLNPENTDGYGVGIFQQQGELYANVNKKDPAAASRAFYDMLLKRVPNYDNPDPAHGGITLADAGQEVQRSGAGAAKYAAWERWATGLAQQLYDGTQGQGGDGGVKVNCKPGGGSGPVRVTLNGLTLRVEGQTGQQFTFQEKRAATAAAAALSYLGTPYAWGGGDPNGPTKGIRDGGVADAHGDYNKIGFDCSGLMLYAYAQAGISLPRTAAAQQTVGNKLPYGNALPGDLVFYGSPAHHVAMYLGVVGGTAYMVEAPQSGDVVKISPVRTGGDFTGTVVRPY